MKVAIEAGSGLPVLTYHSIDDHSSVISTSRRAFRLHMQFLHSQSFRTVQLSEVVAILREDRPVPPRSVCLTFDDGYRSIYSEAFPVLQEYGFTATLFLVVRYCGRHNDWPGNLGSLKRAPLLSWNEVKEMNRFGIECGSHTLTHPDLTRIAPRIAEEEILHSKQEIEEKTGESSTVFAYPYGRYNSTVQKMVRSHFSGACSTKLGNVRTGADPYTMKRIDSWFVSDVKRFSKLNTTSLAWYLQARQALRELRNLAH